MPENLFFCQPTLWLYDLVRMVMSCACFGSRHFSYSKYLCRTSGLLEAETFFNVFSYHAVSGRVTNLSPPRRRAEALRIEPRSRWWTQLLLKLYLWFWCPHSYHYGAYLSIEQPWQNECFFCATLLMDAVILVSKSFSFTFTTNLI